MEKDMNYTEKCPLRFVMDTIGGKWKIPILWELNLNEVMRFNQLKNSVHGITNKMLTNSLQELIEAGLVERVQYNEMPVRVEYFLTDTGKELFPVLKSLTEWGDKHNVNGYNMSAEI